jgi:hypothetical protein
MSLETLYSQLKAIYDKQGSESYDPIKNAVEIQNLNRQIEELKKLEEEERRKNSKQDKEEPGNKRKDDEPTPRDFYKSDADKTAYYDNQEKTKDLPVDAKTGLRELTPYEKQALAQPISGKGNTANWYNRKQVDELSGQNTTQGPEELKNFLKNNEARIKAGETVVVSHIIVNRNGENHLTTIGFEWENGRIKATYIDPNGESMMPKDLAALKNVDIHYIDGVALAKEGKYKTISHDEIVKNPLKETELYRCQFDGHNCGMYGIEMKRMLTVADNDAQAIARGLTAIKNINPEEQRAKHATQLRDIAAGKQIDRYSEYRAAKEPDIGDKAKEMLKNSGMKNFDSSLDKPAFVAKLNQPTKGNGPAVGA